MFVKKTSLSLLIAVLWTVYLCYFIPVASRNFAWPGAAPGRQRLVATPGGQAREHADQAEHARRRAAGAVHAVPVPCGWWALPVPNDSPRSSVRRWHPCARHGLRGRRARAVISRRGCFFRLGSAAARGARARMGRRAASA